MTSERTLGYQEIARQVRERIVRGELQPGERLPAMRALAMELRVNVNTVAHAYAELARDGIVESRRSAGSFVRPADQDALAAERRAAQLREIVGEAALRALSLGHGAAEITEALTDQLRRWRAAGRIGPSALTPMPRFAGSHDLALELLATRLRHAAPPVELQLSFSGSTAGLLALLTGEADLAGCHLGHLSCGESLLQVQRLLPGRRLAVVSVALRQQGLMVPPGNPRSIGGVRDLADPSVRLALRQAGSGTRLLLERALAESGVRRTLASEPVFTTHAEVAASVAQGSTDVGLGILAAGRTFGLDFIPLGWERYDLIIPEDRMRTPAVRTIIETLRGEAFKAAMAALGGYDTSVTGEERWVG